MKRKILFSIIILTVAFSAGIALKTKAGVGDNGSGWLWGGSEEAPDGTINGNETGVGWISMNSTNCDTNGNGSIDAGDTPPAGCPALGTAVADYGVNIPAGNGNVSGEAWSENLGYINFDPAGDFVTYPGCGFPSLPCNSVQRNVNDLEGWARITDIQTELAIGNSGGWEGWIKMRSVVGDPVPYGVGISGVNLTGQAWANREELGWIDFTRALIVIPKTLKICEGGCVAGVILPATIAMVEGNSKSLNACYDIASDCSGGGNVTNLAAWAETDAPENAISLSGGDPQTLSANMVAADSSEDFGVTHDGHIINITVNVSDAAPVCGNGVTEIGEECDDGAAGNGPCPAVCSGSCTINDCPVGTNWHEVAP